MKKIMGLTVAALLALATIAPIAADSTGYEGQPGNQSANQGGGRGQPGNGPNGYEGQPGNQGG
jgi:hypothetical protein